MKIAIVGYGNLGKGVETAVLRQDDMTLVGIFTRRDPSSLDTTSPAYPVDRIGEFDIDVAILCGGSATDLMTQGPEMARITNVVDSFDTHARIPEHAKDMAEAAGDERLALISSGWDPGLFSLARLLGEAVLPEGSTHTFWGKGVSQGHSDAVRRIDGVKYAVQYTIPKEDAVAAVAEGRGDALTTRDKHLRSCYVVAHQDADKDAIRQAIVTMPNYFDEYDTDVHFIDEATFLAEHTAMPHGGQVLRRGETSDGTAQLISFSLTLESNPEFTAAVNVACARAVHRAHQEGRRGCCTIFDMPLSYLSPKPIDELVRTLL